MFVGGVYLPNCVMLCVLFHSCHFIIDIWLFLSSSFSSLCYINVILKEDKKKDIINYKNPTTTNCTGGLFVRILPPLSSLEILLVCLVLFYLSLLFLELLFLLHGHLSLALPPPALSAECAARQLFLLKVTIITIQNLFIYFLKNSEKVESSPPSSSSFNIPAVIEDMSCSKLLRLFMSAPSPSGDGGLFTFLSANKVRALDTDDLDASREHTEPHAEAGDEGGAGLTDFYLRDTAFRSKLDRQHRQGSSINPSSSSSGVGRHVSTSSLGFDGDAGEEEDRTLPQHRHQHLLDKEQFITTAALHLNYRIDPPPFFFSGEDFPSLDPRVVPTAAGDEAVRAAAGGIGSALLHAAAASPSDHPFFFWEKKREDDDAKGISGQQEVVLPCVNPQCSMMLAATRGSDALRELHQLQAVERRNRDTMDTSASDLTILLGRDGATGADRERAAPTAAAAPQRPLCRPPLSSGSAPDAYGTQTSGKGHPTAKKKKKEKEEEEELIKSEVKVEKEEKDEGFGGLGFGGLMPSRPAAAPDMATTSPSSSASLAAASPRGVATPLVHASTAQAESERGSLDDKWLALQESRRQLPIFHCKRDLLRLIGENAVTIVVGETGSGKTTQLVQYLYEAGYARGQEEDELGEVGEEEEEEEEEREKGSEARGRQKRVWRSALTATSSSSTPSPPQSSSANETAAPQPKRRRRRREGSLIGCTQPRRLAAVGVATRVSEEMRCRLGSTVGYSIHLDDHTSDETVIKFMTDGLLLREVMQDPDVRAYKIIVLDEAHERSMDTDILMGTLKAAVARRHGDLKLIVTSATMEVNKFSRFFSDAPSFHVPGKMYPVREVYSSDPVKDYVAEAVYRVCQLHLQTPLTGMAPAPSASSATEEEEMTNAEEGAAPQTTKNDILVFMSGKDDVMGTCELIHRRLLEVNPAARRTLLLLPCLSEGGASLTVRAPAVPPPASTTTPTQYISVLDPTPAGFRKCVVATNVAETSLTIDGVRYVIDSGFMKTNVYRPHMGMNTLQRYPISQAQAAQRKGRAGRTTAGVCYRLYTAHQHEAEMLPQSIPEIQRSSMDSVVLLLKSVLSGGSVAQQQQQQRAPAGAASTTAAARPPRRRGNLQEFDFMDRPPVATIQHSMWTLWVLGLLSPHGDITEAGRQALEFPMSPTLAKFLVEAGQHQCFHEACMVVAMLSADPKHLFDVPRGREEQAQQQHGRFMVPLSDHLTYLNVLQQFLDHCGRRPGVASGGSGAPSGWNLQNPVARRWVKEHFLHMPTLQRAAEVLEQLHEKAHRLRLWRQAYPQQQQQLQPSQGEGRAKDTHDQQQKISRLAASGPMDHLDGSASQHHNKAQRWESVRYCLARSFFLQAAQRGGANWSEYRPLLHPGVLSHLHPGSAVCRHTEMPPYVIYNDLLSLNVSAAASASDKARQQQQHQSPLAEQARGGGASREYLMVVTAVEPEWLAEANKGRGARLYQHHHGGTAGVSSTSAATQYRLLGSQGPARWSTTDGTRSRGKFFWWRNEAPREYLISVFFFVLRLLFIIYSRCVALFLILLEFSSRRNKNN
eukprot:gene7458-5254_t